MELVEGTLVKIKDIPDYCKDSDGTPLEGAPLKLIGLICVVIDPWKDNGMILISSNLENPEEGTFAYHPSKLEVVEYNNDVQK